MIVSIKDVKRVLRTWMIRHRQSISLRARREGSRKIARHVTTSAVFKRAKTVAVFIGFGSEVETETIVKAAWDAKKTVVIPMTDYGLHRSYFVVFKKGDRLFRTSRGPLELVSQRKPFPMSTINLVLVPGLAYDSRGYRLGYGGGVYDRLLLKARRAVSMGLFFETQKMACLPREKHDWALDWIATEGGLLNLAKRPN